MAWRSENYGEERKAEFNQSLGITITLQSLTNSFIAASFDNDLKTMQKINNKILDIISPKVKDGELKDADDKAKEIEDKLPEATETYFSEGGVYFTHPELYNELEFKIRMLYRLIAKLQDKYGYGMKDAEDALAAFAVKEI